MTRAALLTAIVFGAVVSASSHREPQQTTPQFRSGTDAVTIEASVRDGTKVMLGLDAKDFVVTDNGVPQEIYQASYGKLPIDVTVALDISYSVTGDALNRLRRAIAQLMADLSKDDRLKLITFNEQVSRVVDFTSDESAVDGAIQSVRAGGATSILDAISVALVSATGADRRQLVVLLTDGNDSTSATEPQQLLQVAQRSNATVTAVLPSGLVPLAGFGRVRALTTPMSQFQYDLSQFYSKLATDTGGLLIPLTSATSDLTPTFRRALDEFRSSYVLYFTPKGVERGGYHVLTVTVPRNKSYTVRARRGYWGQ